MGKNGLPTGVVAEQASNTARGTPGNRRTGGSIDFGKPRCREAPGSAGPAFGLRNLRRLDCGGTPAFRAPSSFEGAENAKTEDGRTRRQPNNTGGGALAYLIFPAVRPPGALLGALAGAIFLGMIGARAGSRTPAA